MAPPPPGQLLYHFLPELRRHPVAEEIVVVWVMWRRAYSGRGPSQEKMKLEDEDGSHEGQVFKRAKWDSGSSSNASDLALCDPLDEPSPLGLHLRKSPSLVDLIQMRLSQESSGWTAESSLSSMKMKDVKSSDGAATAEKMKASNFLASLLRIGSWECVSRHDGDLIAKFYYAKHKLVWEVLDCGLKSKIEIQWADIRAIRASFPDNGPGAMDIVLVRQPLFFKETNPQPRKHTLWQATSDFTNGQASIHRRHILQCPQGLLNKHFEKLAQCDPQFNMLIQEKDIILDSPFFETKSSIFEDLNDVKSHDFNCLKVDHTSIFPAFHGAGSPCTSQSTSSTVDIHNAVHRKAGAAHSTTASSSVDCQGIGESGGNEKEELKSPVAIPQVNPGLHSFLSVSDLVNHLENCISNQMAAGSHFSSPKGRSACSKDMLEEITQHLLSDSQFISSSAEKSLMSRVNSLCSLLQKDATSAQSLNVKSQNAMNHDQKFIPNMPSDHDQNLVFRSTFDEKGTVKAFSGSEIEFDGHGLGCKQVPPRMSRKDSFTDLLLYLPRITSLSQLLYNVAEENDNQAG